MAQEARRISASEINQAVELIGKLLKPIGPIIVDPKRKQILESSAGIIGRVLAKTDPTTGEFFFKFCRECIEKQAPTYAWREVKDEQGNSYQPRLFAPNDEDTIVAIAAACLISPELPVPLPEQERIQYEKDIASFLGAIERSAEAGKFTYKDWCRTIDDLSHNPTQTAIRDIFSAIGFYGGEYYGMLLAKARKLDAAMGKVLQQKIQTMEDHLEEHRTQAEERKQWSWFQRRLYYLSFGSYKPRQQTASGTQAAMARVKRLKEIFRMIFWAGAAIVVLAIAALAIILLISLIKEVM